MNVIDKLLNCPLDDASMGRIANFTTTSTSPSAYDMKVTAPTFLHRWWRKFRFWQAKREARKDGGELRGAWDDWIWLYSKKVTSTRRALKAGWTVEAQQDFANFDMPRIRAPFPTMPLHELADGEPEPATEKGDHALPFRESTLEEKRVHELLETITRRKRDGLVGMPSPKNWVITKQELATLMAPCIMTPLFDKITRILGEHPNCTIVYYDDIGMLSGSDGFGFVEQGKGVIDIVRWRIA